MIKAKHHQFIYPMFQWLSHFLIKRNFHSVTMEGEFADNGHSVLVIANHVSWWDGFWMMLLNLKVIRRKFHFMMLEEQLQKHWYFRYTGGFSVKRNSRSVPESIRYTVDLLKQPGNMVLLFPQGKIHSMFQNEFRFRKGVKRILEQVAPETQILMVACLTDYFSDAKPNLFISYQLYTANEIMESSAEILYNQFYHQVLDKQKKLIS